MQALERVSQPIFGLYKSLILLRYRLLRMFGCGAVFATALGCLGLLQGCSGVVPVSEGVSPSTQSVANAQTEKQGESGKRPILLVTEMPAVTAGKIASISELQTRESTLLTVAVESPPPGFFLPKDVFGKPAHASAKSFVPTNPVAPAASSVILPLPLVPSASTVSRYIAPQRQLTQSPTVTKNALPTVYIYDSPTSQAYFSAGAVDAFAPVQAWEALLRKKDVPFELLRSVQQLETRPPTVLILPSLIALSGREKRAILTFQRKGGSVVSSWLTGVRDELGVWRGFGFMENALGAKVVGTTEADEDDTYLIPHGDSPITHQVPAGLRIWMARIKEWHPLRLAGKHSAGNFMDWSRAVVPGKSSSTLVYDERDQATGKRSRSVVLGFSERLWVSADAQALDLLIHDALMWALRQPAAYTSAWPYPFSSAFVLAIDAPDTLVETDRNHAKLVGDLGGRATYYILTEQSAKVSDVLKNIQMDEHEIAYLGDRFEGFKELSTGVQKKRIDTMLREMKESGIEIAPDAGVHPPMESYDKTTEKLLKERGLGYLVAGFEASEDRLPFLMSDARPVLASEPAKAAVGLVVLPRTNSDPEDLVSEGDPVTGFRQFLAELDLADKMAGLSVIRLSNRSALTEPQFAEISKYLKARQARIWLASGGQVAQWWRDRGNVSAKLDSTTAPPLLSVTIGGEKPLQSAASVWVNLPLPGAQLRLIPAQQYDKSPKVATIDTWRTAVVLAGFPPGEYHWHLYFDPPVLDLAK